MKEVQKTSECIMWQAPLPNRRKMGLMFERDITPTINLAAGTVVIPAGEEQPKLSVHEGEEIYFVVRGSGHIMLDERAVDVEQGTAVYVAPGVGHRAINGGEDEMELFWVNTPPVFGPVGAYNDFMKAWERIR